MVRNFAKRERIDDDRIEQFLLTLHKGGAILDVAVDMRRQTEILLRERNRFRIDIDDGHEPAGRDQHGGEGSAATSDHQHFAGWGLRQQAKDRAFAES